MLFSTVIHDNLFQLTLSMTPMVYNYLLSFSYPITLILDHEEIMGFHIIEE